MLLAIDAGNSNITIGVFREDTLVVQWRLETHREAASDEYRSQIRNLFSTAGMDQEGVRGVVVASVVPALNRVFTEIAEAEFGMTPLFVDHSNAGIRIRYDQPSSLGADRIVDAVAAIAKYGTPCIVVDFGTATTFNAINSEGEFIGGAISPGLKTCADALFTRTAQLPRVEFAKPEKAIATSTMGALQSGLYHGYAGLVDGVLKQIREEMGGDVRVIATGGLASLIAGASQYISKVDETLTLDGLRLVYKSNLTKGD